MKLKKPQFWDYKKPNIIAYFLWPISITLQLLNSFKKIFISKKKFKNIKTICIGNIYIGGTGKTSLSLKVYEILSQKKFKTCFIKKDYIDQLDEQKILEKKGKLFKSKKSLSVILIKFWIVTFILFLLISSGSIYFKTFLLKYIFLSLLSSLSIPLLITIRLYLGWNHIFKRLNSEKVEYEESGWYDGQIWIKPLNLKEKESLIASLEVKPILKNLTQISSFILIIFLSGILIFQYNGI